MSFKIYPDSIEETHSDNLFRYILKVCNFYKPNSFKSFEHYPNKWIDKNFVSSMINLRKSKAIFSSIYDTIQLSNELQKIPFENNLENIASDFLQINKENFSLRSMLFRMDFPDDTRNSYGWHQDGAYDLCNIYPKNGAVIWTPLVNTNEENGTLEIMPGSELSSFDCSKRVSSEEKYISEQILVQKKYLDKYKLKSVDVKKNNSLVMDSGMFHRSGMNVSDHIRFTIIVRYFNQHSKDYIIFRKLKKN